MTDNIPDMWFNKLFSGRAMNVPRSEIRELLKLLERPDVISFAGGIPHADMFPSDRIRQAYDRLFGTTDTWHRALQYSTSEGYPPLREWIASYLTDQPTPWTKENIIVTSGSQQALDLLARLFISPGERIAFTRPSYLGALQVLRFYQPEFVAIDEDDEGILIEPLIAALDKGLKFIYLIPDFNNPTGISLSLRRREQVIDLALARGVPIIEDLAYVHLRYNGENIPTLGTLALRRLNSQGSEHTPIVQIGTFSKSICPGLRIGWVRAASVVIDHLTVLKQSVDLHASTINQMVVADILTDSFDTCIQKEKAFYRLRMEAMLDALKRYFPRNISWTMPEGGFFVWVNLPEGLDGSRLLESAVTNYKVAFVPGGAFYCDGTGKNTLRLSFSGNEVAEIQEGIMRMGELLHKELCVPKVPKHAIHATSKHL
ncbi:MAG: PLP-dependent aminotransferase family protein [Gallionellaceae bacterium]|nr:PLP-dependent aminotransferase family protein [Gallionellaceae bacterium]